MIRGKKALDAYEIVRFSNKYAAQFVAKALKSALANAEHNSNLDKANLIVTEAFVNEAPTFKRGRAVSKGRYHQILKRNSHIIIGLSEAKLESGKEDKSVKSEKAKNSEKEVKKTETKTKKSQPKAAIKSAKSGSAKSRKSNVKKK